MLVMELNIYLTRWNNSNKEMFGYCYVRMRLEWYVIVILFLYNLLILLRCIGM